MDPGWEADFLINLLAVNNLNAQALLATHIHADHIAAAARMADVLACPIYLSSQEISCSDYQHPHLKPFHHHEVIQAGTIECRVILTPGHTAGSTSFLIGERLFTGDTLFMEGCGLCSGPTGSMAQMYASLALLKSIIPDATKVYPGHLFTKPLGASFGSLKVDNFYLKINSQAVFNSFCGRLARQKNAPPPIGSVGLVVPGLVNFET